MSPGRPPLGAALLLLFASRASSRDNLTCADGQDSDWWNNSDGLNPCEQYQQLMQICDPTYTVQGPNASLPFNDVCWGTNTSCCCNSVAFNIAMLCGTCQVGGSGADAPTGTYTLFLNGCTPAYIGKMDADVQTSACRNGPSLMNWTYSIPQYDGSWLYSAAAINARHQDDSIACDNLAAPPTPSPGSPGGLGDGPTSSAQTTSAPGPSASGRRSHSGISGHTAVLVAATGIPLAATLVAVLGIVHWRRRRIRHRAQASTALRPYGMLHPSNAPPSSSSKLARLGLSKTSNPFPYEEHRGDADVARIPRKYRWFYKGHPDGDATLPASSLPVVRALDDTAAKEYTPESMAALSAAMQRVGFSVSALLTSLSRIDPNPAALSPQSETGASDALPPTYVRHEYAHE